MGQPMLEAAALTGLDTPSPGRAKSATAASRVSGGCSAMAKERRRHHLTEDIAYSGVKFYLPRCLGLMGGQREMGERIALLRDYQVNSQMMALTGNPQVKFLHCLPAFHDIETTSRQKMAEEYGLHGGMRGK
ncbi:hypothetical protein KCP78_22870 [Salmonella enterica subsp. enterica]|nr:hypothetical protein KCP78_22870 [Salmonella enterica subsp. enterica]